MRSRPRGSVELTEAPLQLLVLRRGDRLLLEAGAESIGVGLRGVCPLPASSGCLVAAKLAPTFRINVSLVQNGPGVRPRPSSRSGRPRPARTCATRGFVGSRDRRLARPLAG